MLQHLRIEALDREKVTSLGLIAIMHAIIQSSPRLNFITMYGYYEKNVGLQTAIEGILRAAGWKACLYIAPCR